MLSKIVCGEDCIFFREGFVFGQANQKNIVSKIFCSVTKVGNSKIFWWLKKSLLCCESWTSKIFGPNKKMSLVQSQEHNNAVDALTQLIELLHEESLLWLDQQSGYKSKTYGTIRTMRLNLNVIKMLSNNPSAVAYAIQTNHKVTQQQIESCFHKNRGTPEQVAAKKHRAITLFTNFYRHMARMLEMQIENRQEEQ
jgi:hypothetical protein